MIREIQVFILQRNQEMYVRYQLVQPLGSKSTHNTKLSTASGFSQPTMQRSFFSDPVKMHFHRINENNLPNHSKYHPFLR